MDPWRDYPNFTDGALDAFIKRFPSHPDHAAARAEFERRRKERDQGVEGRSLPVGKIRVDKGIFIWIKSAVIAGVTILALAVLYFALPSFTSRTQRVRRPVRSSASFPEPIAPFPKVPSADGLTRGPYSSKPSTTNTPSPEFTP